MDTDGVSEASRRGLVGYRSIPVGPNIGVSTGANTGIKASTSDSVKSASWLGVRKPAPPSPIAVRHKVVDSYQLQQRVPKRRLSYSKSNGAKK